MFARRLVRSLPSLNYTWQRNRPKPARRSPLLLERLEDRTLLSTSIPLNSNSWTAIGPAPVVDDPVHPSGYSENTSGRITALAAAPNDADTVYIAAAGGGIWKTTNATATTVTWTHLTDNLTDGEGNPIPLFTGAIALAPSNPRIIYAGTGEANFGPSKADARRDNIYYGRGVLKSTDAGDHWTLLKGNAGLNEFDRQTISKIVVDPADPLNNTVYVAIGARATNGLSGTPGITGIWKSTDGGTSWSRMVNGISALSDNDAVSDLVMDPSNSQTLYAAVGTPRGGAANGVYKTTDGGATWSLLDRNFPVGPNAGAGRIALAVAPTAPQTVYAIIAGSGSGATFGSVFKVMKTVVDGPQTTWAELTRPGAPICPPNSNLLGVAGDYHITVAVDPSDANKIYCGGL